MLHKKSFSFADQCNYQSEWRNRVNYKYGQTSAPKNQSKFPLTIAINFCLTAPIKQFLDVFLPSFPITFVMQKKFH